VFPVTPIDNDKTAIKAMSHSIILVVDDAPENIAILSDLLRPNHQIRVANSGNRALELARIEPLPDLICWT